MTFVRALGRLIFHLVASLVVALVVGVLVTIVTATAEFPWGSVASLLTFIGYWVWRFIQSVSAPRYDTGAPPIEQLPDIPRSHDSPQGRMQH